MSAQRLHRLRAWLATLICCGAAWAAPGEDDTAPGVAVVWPAPDATGVSLSAEPAVTFTEPVALSADAFLLSCAISGNQATTTQGDGTAFTFTPVLPLPPNQLCTALVRADGVTDQDENDPPDAMPTDWSWSFRTAGPPVLINEVDAITAGDTHDFIELYDGGVGGNSLDGLSLVFYQGARATVYLALSLNGQQTDGRGYFVAGGLAVDPDLRLADGALRDGPDAIALYAAPASRFPVGSPVTLEDLVDAVVYSPGGEPVPALSPLLLSGEVPVNEGDRGAPDSHSSQRYPNGGGLAREMSAFVAAPPTPGDLNSGPVDDAPAVVSVSPADGAGGISPDVTLQVTFSEPVSLGSQPLEIACTASGEHAYGLNGGTTTYGFRPYQPFTRGETCVVTVFADRLSDVDTYDPPDQMPADFNWSFTVAPQVAESVIINEVDADTPGSDTAEFIELYDGGTTGTSLDGLLIVLFNGSDDASYRTVDLTGHVTGSAGYFVLGSAAVPGVDLVLPNGALQNGPDAVALLAGRAEDYPAGTSVAGITPQDAVVYGPDNSADTGLLALLNPGQPMLDEDGRGERELHSNQRCPNGAGGARNSAGFRQNTPTPGAASDCVTDTAPTVTERIPGPGTQGVAAGAAISIAFSEPVTVNQGWLTVTCSLSGTHGYTTSGGPDLFVAQPVTPFAHDETCTATVKAARVQDVDSDDPPDTLANTLTWSFTTAEPPPGYIMINEIDPDTPGSDMAEFIELYDDGRGGTPLDGLVLVLYNGYTNSVYRSLDLDGHTTSPSGYWLAGNAGLAPDLVFPDGVLQNGPDAVALFAGDAAQFPNGAPVETNGLLDAVVYGDAGGAAGLLPLLLSGETAADEAARDGADSHALQRCPNGSGGQRRTASFRPGAPTPGAPSNCTADAAPAVTSVAPADQATGVAATATLAVTFSEPVLAADDWLRLRCGDEAVALVLSPAGATAYTATPTAPLPPGTTCRATIAADLVRDADGDDPPDRLPADVVWSFVTAAPVADFVLINELDADTPGSDTAEFIELYDGGRGQTNLSGLALIFYNGKSDSVYYAVDLDGVITDAAGFALAGSESLNGAIALPAAVLQNGPDAVALVAGDAAQFPNGTPVSTTSLLDAIVYGTADPPDAGLLPLLFAGEPQVDEAGRGASDSDSSSRCPDGAGGARRTSTYRPTSPTPGAPNDCRVDEPPTVVAVSPPDGTENVPVSARLAVTFSEPVDLDTDWFTLDCSASGRHPAATSGGPVDYLLTPTGTFAPGEQCTVSLDATAIHDSDTIDPPDSPAAGFAWSFTTAPPTPPEGILINEVDSDTTEGDAAEFIELYDGGRGLVDLSGLVVVMWNGSGDRAYAAVDLAGHTTDAGGYFVLGAAGLPGSDLQLPVRLQDGPDAVALHAGSAAGFPDGTPLTAVGLQDAIVYGAAGEPDIELLALLEAGQPQVDEAQNGNAVAHSLQRCPNGAGGPRRTLAFRAAGPTPGQANACAGDAPPMVTGVLPPPDADDVPLSATLVITFSETVDLTAGWLTLACDGADQALTVVPGPARATATPAQPLPPGAVCIARVAAAAVADRDADDPPDHPAADTVWRFTTALAPPSLVAGFRSNSPVWVGEAVVFVNTTTGPGPIRYLWDFGDGTGAAAEHPTHLYLAPGVYPVTLTATATTTATATAEVVVRARAIYAPVVAGR